MAKDEKNTPPSAIERRHFLARVTGGAFSVAACMGGGWLIARGQGGAVIPCLRPPGALGEVDFLARCIRCGRCIDACPNRCIVSFTEEAGKDLCMAPGEGQTGTPAIFPRRQACMLCNGTGSGDLLCTAACPSGALRRTRRDIETIQAEVKMGIAELDKNLCYSFNGASCGACVRACPLEGRALSAGMWEKPIIDQTNCVGCGLCERSCIRYPQAIRVRPREA